MKTFDLINHLIEEHKITFRQAKFCVFYAGNATDAGKAAGYKNPQECSRLLHKPTIQAALTTVDRLKNTQSICTREEILESYSEIARTATDTKDKLKALDSLARTNGMFLDKQAILGKFSVEHLDRLTDQELEHKAVELLGFLAEQGINLGLALPSPDQTDGTDEVPESEG